ncbi:MAG: NifU family protein [Deltaproteobacteria bacterium]|jgi:Fe-S cluster biogenesis protein NfuA|nr:NifU family protein [Deltaproteobacteria bacterium]
MDERAVEAALNKVRPTLIADGGDVELVDIKDGVVQVRLTGACSTCPMAQLTLKMGVEKAVKADLPEVKEVVAAYKHEAAGC